MFSFNWSERMGMTGTAAQRPRLQEKDMMYCPQMTRLRGKPANRGSIYGSPSGAFGASAVPGNSAGGANVGTMPSTAGAYTFTL